MKKLLILAYEYPPIGGGTGQALERMLRVWPKDSGWEIEIWTAAAPKGADRTLLKDIDYFEFSCVKKNLHYWRSRELLFLLWKMWRKTLGDDPLPEAVLVWGGWPLGMLLLGALGAVPSILSLRGSDVPGFNPRASGALWKFLAKRVWKRAGLVTANSPALVHLAHGALPSLPIEIVPNGVETPELESSRDFPSEDRPLRLLAVNRLVPRKRVDWIFNALSHLPPQLRDLVELAIAGDGPERYRLETMRRELNLQKRIVFFGEVPPGEMPRLYREADLFILASQAEGLSNALLEAMAHGLPCLTATETGFPDIDNATIRTDRPERIAQQLRLLMTDPERYREAGEECREVASRYNWTSVAGKYAEFLNRLAMSERTTQARS